MPSGLWRFEPNESRPPQRTGRIGQDRRGGGGGVSPPATPCANGRRGRESGLPRVRSFGLVPPRCHASRPEWEREGLQQFDHRRGTSATEPQLRKLFRRLAIKSSGPRISPRRPRLQQACLDGVRARTSSCCSSARSMEPCSHRDSRRPMRSTKRPESGSPYWCSSNRASPQSPRNSVPRRSPGLGRGS